MKTKTIFYFIVLFFVFLIFSGTMFTVNQIEQAVITRLGKPVRVINEPGLHFKIPLLEVVAFFDKRLMSVELSALEVTLGDKRRIMVDAFGRYIITDPLKFYQAVGSERGVLDRLNPVVRGSLSSVLGGENLSSLLSETRISVMNRIRDEVNRAVRSFGIVVVDLRIRKTDLPPQNSAAICNRMISEREREARELRAKGIEIAQVIKSTADKENAISLSEANTKVQILIAEGECEAYKIYIEASLKDKDFFKLFQTLEAYHQAFNSKNSTVVLSTQSAFFALMKGK
ncbi:MAG: protease modulator HflC [Holosporaceae bacterium]|jgi:membrane protease subunit HflC|nr:protease modulator HflC [Holosporaceae bacterium]